MNLRLDGDSIRVRLSWDEAWRLSRDHEIIEALPVFEDGSKLCVQVAGRELNFFSDQKQRSFNLSVPKEKLDAIMALGAGSVRPQKHECELQYMQELRGRPIEIRFEVDHFTYVKKAQEEGCCGICGSN